MDKELLMLYGARNAVLRIHERGPGSFAKRIDDEKWETVEWIDIVNYLSDMIDKYNVGGSKDGQ